MITSPSPAATEQRGHWAAAWAAATAAYSAAAAPHPAAAAPAAAADPDPAAATAAVTAAAAVTATAADPECSSGVRLQSIARSSRHQIIQPGHSRGNAAGVPEVTAARLTMGTKE